MRNCSVVADSLQPHGLWPTRLFCRWNFSGMNTGVGCHFLLQFISSVYAYFQAIAWFQLLSSCSFILIKITLTKPTTFKTLVCIKKKKTSIVNDFKTMCVWFFFFFLIHNALWVIHRKTFARKGVKMEMKESRSYIKWHIRRCRYGLALKSIAGKQSSLPDVTKAYLWFARSGRIYSQVGKFHRRVFVLFFKMITEEHLGLPIILG